MYFTINLYRFSKAYSQDNTRCYDLCKMYGRLDLLITFMCNLLFIKIKNILRFGQLLKDRSDIITRLFQWKLRKIKVYKKGLIILTNTMLHVYCEMAVKRIFTCQYIVWLKERLQTTDNIIMMAEILYPNQDLAYNQCVILNMVYKLCGVINNKCGCMKTHMCTKQYIKKFINEIITDDGYLYNKRRSTDNYELKNLIKFTGDRTVVLDN